MNLENYLNSKPKLPEGIKTIDQLFEKINTPEELSEYMEKNLEYGYVGKESNRIYSSVDADFDNNFDKEYILQTPEQLLISKHGVCWDQVELERSWFLKKEYKIKVYFLMFAKDELNNLPTHTFLAYKKDGKFYWFENSFSSQKGIHEYKDLNSLIEDVKNKQFDYAKKECGAVADDFNDIKVCEYETPKFGCNPDEYMTSIIDNNLKKGSNDL
ncbi:MAG: transglutaminase-like domain-containing protein [Patescibacteria group bacterium]